MINEEILRYITTEPRHDHSVYNLVIQVSGGGAREEFKRGAKVSEVAHGLRRLAARLEISARERSRDADLDHPKRFKPGDVAIFIADPSRYLPPEGLKRGDHVRVVDVKVEDGNEAIAISACRGWMSERFFYGPIPEGGVGHEP